jgi:hypothetical protein
VALRGLTVEEGAVLEHRDEWAEQLIDAAAQRPATLINHVP